MSQRKNPSSKKSSGRRAFVIRPFGIKKDSAEKDPKTINFEEIHAQLIQPALEATHFGGGTAGEILDAGNIRTDMFRLLLNADMVICDLTIHNANVFYELGIRHAFRKKRTVLIKGTPSADKTPFDVQTDRYLAYEIDNPGAYKEKLIKAIEATMASSRETDSPVFTLLSDLNEPKQIWEVPLDFREEVERARSVKWKGWLRLLAEEVLTRNFSWAGLRLVADAQWKIKDFEGACDSWEKIRNLTSKDIQANDALANIYERRFRNSGKVQDLKKSDQAIKRVLENENVTREQKVEALTLLGRNKKTRWRKKFEGDKSIANRREKAMNGLLRESYEAYLKAFYQDLNHYYSGLGALQMGTIFLHLSETDDGWMDIFDDDETAESYRKNLERDCRALQYIVPVSVSAALQQMKEPDPWAEVSQVDIWFLTEKRKSKIIKAYEKAILENDPFVWDAAKRQIELFINLGVKAELGKAIIDTIEKQLPHIPQKTDKPKQIILFAGHRIDAPDREGKRFPADLEDTVRQELKKALEGIVKKDHEVLGLASGAPGGDILFHEACTEMGFRSDICLPMPTKDYVRTAFQDLDTWRSRFLNLKEEHKVYELSDREGLPNWLQDAQTNPWERGNRWSVEMARTADANAFNFLALWDGKKEGDAPGGTAHMIDLARATDQFHVKIVNL